MPIPSWIRTGSGEIVLSKNYENSLMLAGTNGLRNELVTSGDAVWIVTEFALESDLIGGFAILGFNVLQTREEAV
jgi:hypothetical protein